MGMFDTIATEHKCPYCGEKNKDYQTKALVCSLNYFSLGHKPEFDGAEMIEGNFEIHSNCEKCSKSYEGRAYVRKGIIVRITQFKGELEQIVAELKDNK